MNLNLTVSRNFHKHRATTKKIVISQGGGRSGKTFSILQLFIMTAIERRGLLLSVVAENLPFLKRGAIRDFKTIMQSIGLWQDEAWNRTNFEYTLPNNSVIEFFSADSSGKALGAARDYLFINECNNVKYEIAFQLLARTRKRCFLDFNPVAEFWAHTEILNNPAFDGQVDFVHSTFLDNQLLDAGIKQTMLARAAIDSNYRTVYIDGQIGSLEGLIFPSINLIDDLPERHEAGVIGLDFGYTQDPTSAIHVIDHAGQWYFDELLYRTGMRNTDINSALTNHKHLTIFADSSDPKSIDDLYLYGLNIHPVVKGADSIQYGIDLMKQQTINVTKRSVNLIKELRNYTYDRDKEGKLINKPIDFLNHAIDAARYGVMMKQRGKHEYHTLPNTDNTRRL